ncbi:bifunctional metallophosphatase/5'-nucleotidase [Runella slithyformis]|uniref:5'-nucleotidase n=1 Tax=Runella slithyformis (strain ATCC 29530 / DSM 19594 / LMG 11500 / NCIMB 11436 / LSU 4) TaxID=761193 RepID=A0A7U3ZLQ7_RUNSL|nr:metallophosphatase [Runella slithyformis]AEI49535.1 5'-nucleotidase [Runella slithyformis DSM 19594]
MKRRLFLKNILGTGGAIALGQWPLETWAATNAPSLKVTILHTNDQHSRLEPFPKTDRLAGRGGVVNRARILSKIRAEEANVLLFDAGDIFQGTPYFNFYKGRPEIELMSRMGYDAVTMGNHDFDGGLDLYVKQIKDYAKFPVLVANYDFKGTAMEGLAQPYKIFTVQGVKIGVFGLGIDPKGLIPEKLFGGTKYLDPIKTANETAAFLRNEKKCSLVVCLSHLGYKMSEGEVSDLIMAPQTKDIDLIIGGHTHTFLNEPTALKNLAGKPVLVNQAGWGGASLGRLDFTFDRVSRQVFYTSQEVAVQ